MEIAFNATALNNKNKYGDGYKAFDNIDEIASAGDFGNIPVVVFSADQSQRIAIDQFGNDAVNWHSNLAQRLSKKTEHIMVNNSSHFIQKDQPQVVIKQIEKMLN